LTPRESSDRDEHPDGPSQRRRAAQYLDLWERNLALIAVRGTPVEPAKDRA
jgi:hypothetical protein